MQLKYTRFSFGKRCHNRDHLSHVVIVNTALLITPAPHYPLPSEQSTAPLVHTTPPLRCSSHLNTAVTSADRQGHFLVFFFRQHFDEFLACYAPLFRF